MNQTIGIWSEAVTKERPAARMDGCQKENSFFLELHNVQYIAPMPRRLDGAVDNLTLRPVRNARAIGVQQVGEFACPKNHERPRSHAL